GEAVVVDALHGDRAGRALTVALALPAGKVVALEFPAGVFLDLRAFVGADRVEVAVGSEPLAVGRIDFGRAVEAAHARRSAGLPALAGARPSGPCRARIDGDCLIGIGSDEVVVERAVVELDDRRADF